MSFSLPLATYNAGVRQVKINLDFLGFLRREFLVHARTEHTAEAICSAMLIAEEYLDYLVYDMANNQVSERGIALSEGQGVMINLFQDNLNDAIAELYHQGISFTEQ